MRLISDRVYSAWLTAKVLLYQKMTFIFRELITFLNLPIPFLPRPHFPVHSPSLCPVWFPSKPSHRCPVNIFKMLPECVALLLSRRLTATVHPAGRVTGAVEEEEEEERQRSGPAARPQAPPGRAASLSPSLPPLRAAARWRRAADRPSSGATWC